MVQPHKRSKLSQVTTAPEEQAAESSASGSDSHSSADESEGTDISGAESSDDEDDILRANQDAHTVTKKKRKRALPSNAFGAQLSSLLAAPLPTKPLRPLHPDPAKLSLEKKAHKLLLATRHERQERGHITDIIAGWSPRPSAPFSEWPRIDMDAQGDFQAGGAEKEKELRRLAQKGVVRLFNAIKAAQTTAEDNSEQIKKGNTVQVLRGEGAKQKRRSKEASPAASVTSETSNASKTAFSNTVFSEALDKRTNLLGGMGKQAALSNLSKASFLELIKMGGSAK